MYRLYPTKKQLNALETTLEECRWLYNTTLAYRKEAWEQEQRTVSYYDSKARLPVLKAERPSLKKVHSQVLQNVTERVELAFQGFFRRVKDHAEDPGYPRFKGYGRYDSFTFTQSGFSIVSVVSVPRTASLTTSPDARVMLSKIGSVKMVYHRPVKGTVKTCTIRRSSTGKWYVSFSCEVEPERLPQTSSPVGIDVGLKTFATLSNGEEMAHPRFFRKEEKALAKVQRKHSKLAQGSPERRKHRKVVARVHERIKFRRDNFTHQQSRQIVDRFGVICVEDLHVNRMTHNHCLAKSIQDAAWSGFFDKLFSKAAEAGRTALKVNPAYTSQDCSRCHHRQKMPLSERVYHCPCCLLAIDRDLNAAKNICAVGLHSLGLALEAPCL
jgi:putative transposase